MASKNSDSHHLPRIIVKTGSTLCYQNLDAPMMAHNRLSDHDIFFWKAERAVCFCDVDVTSSEFEMALFEQHTNIKCYVLLQKSLSELLTMSQKDYGDSAMKKYTDKNCLNNTVTGGETWCFLYDLQTKCESSEWKSASSPVNKCVDMSKGRLD